MAKAAKQEFATAATLSERFRASGAGCGQFKAQKHLTFYELDLGLNPVSRKWSESIDNGANGGGDGPSGGVNVSIYDIASEDVLT